MWLIKPSPSTLWRAPACGPAPGWRWERHFWSFRPTWGLDSGGTTPAAGLLEVGASVPVLERAARSARISMWTGRPERDRASRACPGPEIPHETQDLPLAASRAGSSRPEAFAAGSLRRRKPSPRRPGSGHARPRWRRRTVTWRTGMPPVSEAAEGAGYGRQSPTVPGDAAGAGPEGWTLPAHIVRRPQERSTRPNVPLCSTAPSGSVVLQTCPDETSIDVRTRPDDDRASTVHGSAGRVATSIVGAGPRGGKSPIGRPFTTRVTVRVVPFEIPSWGSGFAVGPGEVVVHAARPTMSKAARRAVRSFPVIDMPTPRRSNWPSRSAGLAWRPAMSPGRGSAHGSIKVVRVPLSWPTRASLPGQSLRSRAFSCRIARRTAQ
jgi:hypothetical protein